jgi:hypothetical protein
MVCCAWLKRFGISHGRRPFLHEVLRAPCRTGQLWLRRLLLPLLNLELRQDKHNMAIPRRSSHFQATGQYNFRHKNCGRFAHRTHKRNNNNLGIHL